MEWFIIIEVIFIFFFNCYRKIGYKNFGKYCMGYCIYKLIFGIDYYYENDRKLLSLFVVNQEIIGNISLNDDF